MKNLKIRIVVTAACLLVTIVVVSQLIHAQAPTAPRVQRVLVQNPTGRPVPVAVQGSVNVVGNVGAARQNWEYQIITFTGSASPEEMKNRLDAQGAQGWELVGFSINNWFVLKRAR